MDIAAIPKVESIVLMGLDFSMRPENVRFEASNGFITPLPANIVMHKIKSLALMVYEQEKLTPLYHANVCEESNPLAYFLCAMHRQSSPQSQKQKSRHASVDSNDSIKSKACSRSSNGSKKSCELPRLVTSSVLPLSYWDSLYYALVVEIRLIYYDLQKKFGWAIEHGYHPLHYCGVDAKTAKPVTAVELASVLETAWYALMDNRLVATLDDAVRMRKLQDSMRKCGVEGDEADSARPPIVQGLIDVNGLKVEAIAAMLWDKHAHEVDEACARDFEDESMSTAHGAALNTQTIPATHMPHTGMPLSPSCRCGGECICRLRCETHGDECTCAPGQQSYHQTGTFAEHNEAGAAFSDISLHQPAAQKTMFGDPTSASSAEMEVQPNHALVLNSARRSQEESMSRSFERQVPSRSRYRQRTDTNNSELAYVPDGKPSRAKGKDAYPLGFYHDGSPGRYPKIRKDSAMAANEATSIRAMRAVVRKPVPPPVNPTRKYISPDAGYGVVTPPSDERYVAAKAQAAYAENARRSRIMMGQVNCVTESFPLTSDNPERAVDSDPFIDSPSPINPAQDYVGLLARHPSSYDQNEEATEPFPTLYGAVTTPPRAPKPLKSKPSRSRLPSLKSFSGDTTKPMPPLPPLPNLPVPEFINPRPALVQRYVSAGGSLPLADRPEIQGPAFHTTGFNTPAGVVSHSSGAGITKTEIEAKTGDPEWVKSRFGPEAVLCAAPSGSAPPKQLRGSEDISVGERNSGQSSRSVHAGSHRPSVEQQTMQVYNPRDRTSSGVSSTKAKFKRVFSRKHSGTEFD